MLMNPFRKNHAIKVLIAFQSVSCPLDFFLHRYFKENHSIGSNDRKEISELVYRYIRWKGLIDVVCRGSIDSKIDFTLSFQPEDYLNDDSLPLHVRLSFPKDYVELLSHTFNEKELIDFCFASNEKAPITLRSNPLKITREELMTRLSDRFVLECCQHSPYGIQVIGKANLFSTPEFQEGLFEMQDEGSQLISLLVEAEPGDAVMDFCAGSAGKTLGFAHTLNHRGQIFLHDIREKALQEGKKRLNRAGIQNFQILKKETPNWNKHKNRMDWVLVDAPCSGSGTLRRNPDQKWKFTQEFIIELTCLQRTILKEAVNFLKPGGHLVFATCSVLKEENQNQLDYLLSHFPLKLIKEPFISVPKSGQMDGFFAATLEKL